MPRSHQCYMSPVCFGERQIQRGRVQKFQPLFSTLAWIANFFFNSFQFECIISLFHFIPFELFKMTLRKVPILIILSDFIFFRSLDSAFVIHISQSRSIEMARHIEMKSEKKNDSSHQMEFVWSHFMVERIDQWVICKFTKAISCIKVCEWSQWECANKLCAACIFSALNFRSYKLKATACTQKSDYVDKSEIC